MTQSTRVVFFALVMGAITIGCGTTNQPANVLDGTRDQVCEEDAVYVSLLSTKKHKLAGVNPTVGLFIGTDSLGTWRHVGWKQGRTFASMPLGCGDTLFVAAGNGVMRSTDGGETWRITTDWKVTEVQDVAVDPSGGGVVLAATPYGLFRSTDFGDSWENVSEGLPATFVASVRFDRRSTHHVMAGTEGGLAVSHDAGESWDLTTVTSPVRSVRQSAVDPDRWVVGLLDKGVAVSDDGGITWQSGSGAIASKTIYEAEFDPRDAATIYAAGWETGVLKTENFGRTWSQIAPGFEDRGIHAIGVRDPNGSEVLVGTMNDGLYVTRDDGANWEAIDPAIFELSQVWDIFVRGEQ